ncbi:MarR family transcriptional regulator [Patulibacter sp. SYSU D01012]|uniref:MarR family winged helix-turn-helix transcriptional regulator n=1 Tax=Patulibacter sp. SYSU D01012 TaxID=2817381 RepID=UPI001B306248|nr:MarR family transcriptional regulator [Patulibacter sp. SYSU D01012]
MATAQTPPRAAFEAWRRIGELLELERCRTAALARELDLSSSQLLALRALDPAEPQRMGQLAGALECDKGNVTGIVDRLERRGLVERRPVDHDRRVKVLALTPAGAQLRAEIEERLATPPDELAALADDDLGRLAHAVGAVLDARRAARCGG